MLYQYILEFKSRILLIVVSWFVTLLICYCYKETLLFIFASLGPWYSTLCSWAHNLFSVLINIQVMILILFSKFLIIPGRHPHSFFHRRSPLLVPFATINLNSRRHSGAPGRIGASRGRRCGKSARSGFLSSLVVARGRPRFMRSQPHSWIGRRKWKEKY